MLWVEEAILRMVGLMDYDTYRIISKLRDLCSKQKIPGLSSIQKLVFQQLVSILSIKLCQIARSKYENIEKIVDGKIEKIVYGEYKVYNSLTER